MSKTSVRGGFCTECRLDVSSLGEPCPYALSDETTSTDIMDIFHVLIADFVFVRVSDAVVSSIALLLQQDIAVFPMYPF